MMDGPKITRTKDRRPKKVGCSTSITAARSAPARVCVKSDASIHYLHNFDWLDQELANRIEREQDQTPQVICPAHTFGRESSSNPTASSRSSVEAKCVTYTSESPFQNQYDTGHLFLIDIPLSEPL